MTHNPKPHLRVSPAAGGAREPVSPRGLPLVVRAGWQRLKATHHRLDDSLLGDAVGFCLIALTAWLIFVIAACLP